MKVQLSHRLDEELASWATEYGASRGTSRAIVIEEALRHFRALSKGGVPDLPVVDAPEVRELRVATGSPKPVPGVTTAGALARHRANPLGAERQRAIEAQKAKRAAK